MSPSTAMFPARPAALLLTLLVPVSLCAQKGTSQAASKRSAYQVNSVDAPGGSLFLGDQAPGTQNGLNTVAGINTGGRLSPGSTGYGGQNNTFFGSNVAPGATTARETTCIGSQACYALIGADAGIEDTIITAVGSQAAGSLTTGGLGSAFFGQKSGISLTSSYQDVFLGTHSGTQIQHSTASVIVGGFTADTGNYTLTESTIVGSGAYQAASTTDEKKYDVVMGARAMPRPGASQGNSVIGWSAATNLTSGTYNTCLGFRCMYGQSGGQSNDITGTYNIGLGSDALESVSTGSHNIALGALTGNDMKTGSYNILMGDNVGNRVGSGSWNILIGGGFGETYNYSNAVAIGWLSGRNPIDQQVFVGALAGQGNGGTGNVYVGRNTGKNITSGNHNTAVGEDAMMGAGGSDSNNTAIGSDADIQNGCSNTVQIGPGLNWHCGTVQFGPNQLMDATGSTLQKGALLRPAEIFHVTTDGTTSVTIALANWADDSAVAFGARNSLAAANMSGVFATNATHGQLNITVPAVAGMQFDVTVTETHP